MALIYNNFKFPTKLCSAESDRNEIVAKQILARYHYLILIDIGWYWDNVHKSLLMDIRNGYL